MLAGFSCLIAGLTQGQPRKARTLPERSNSPSEPPHLEPLFTRSPNLEARKRAINPMSRFAWAYIVAALFMAIFWVPLTVSDLDGILPSFNRYGFLWDLTYNVNIRAHTFWRNEAALAIVASAMSVWLFHLRRETVKRDSLRYLQRFAVGILRCGFSCVGWISNRRRDLCIWLGCGIFAIAAAIPPWNAFGGLPSNRAEIQLGHFPLWQPPATSRRASARIDYGRAALEILSVESVIAGLYLTWGKRAPRRSSN